MFFGEHFVLFARQARRSPHDLKDKSVEAVEVDAWGAGSVTRQRLGSDMEVAGKGTCFLDISPDGQVFEAQIENEFTALARRKVRGMTFIWVTAKLQSAHCLTQVPANREPECSI
jgi:hypothetical protein